MYQTEGSKECFGSWSEASACIGSIFSHGVSINELYRPEPWLVVHPEYVERKPAISREDRVEPFKSKQIPKRGSVKGFSRKSRTRLFKQFGRLIEPVQVWQDHTFPDEVFEGKTIEKKAEFTSEVLKLFKERDRKNHPDLFGWWKREWEPRKSGRLVGQECPHFHQILGGLPGITKENYQEVCQDRARCFVDAMIYVARKFDSGRTDQEWKEIREKAIKVNCNSRSYRWIESKKMAFVYVSKYVGKVQEQSWDDQCSRGRYWGVIGTPPLGEPVEFRLNESEDVWLRRMIRRMMKARARSKGRSMNGFEKRIYNSCRVSSAFLFLFIDPGQLYRLLNWVLQATAPPF